MNKSAIRNFAVSARRKLMEGVEQKAYELGITKNEVKETLSYDEGFRVNNRPFKKFEAQQREKLIQKINENGFDHVVEEVAYTWFNRFIAIRFMEVNDYLPTGVRVFSSIIEGKTEPDAVTEVDMIADELDLDMDKVYKMQDNNDTEDLFKYILVKQCNKLGEIMPVMFEAIQDYTELLLPDNLLAVGSVVRDMVTMIEEQDWTEQVEIIGWLYQYYISEKKAEVDEKVKLGKKVKKEDVAAKTQLFTPKWIVQFMVENSLGRLWIETKKDTEIKSGFNYHVENIEQDNRVVDELNKIKKDSINPEDIKILDPCMGSGHILIYAFEVLYEIYKEVGYSEKDIPLKIIENNLYGLDIDGRAAQLSHFSLLMKACSYNRAILNYKVSMNVLKIEQSNSLSVQAVEYFTNFIEEKADNANLKRDIEYLINVFYDAEEFGSIIDVKDVDFVSIENNLEHIQKRKRDDLFVESYLEELLNYLPPLIRQGRLLSNKYDVVITNPPYLSVNNMDSKLAKHVKKYFPLTKANLSAIYLDQMNKLIKEKGYISILNQQSWMFTSRYEKMRKELLENELLITLAHLGPRAFDFGGEVVQSVCAIIQKVFIDNYNTLFIDVTAYDTDVKKLQIFNKNNYFVRKQKVFFEIDGAPFAYRASERVRKNFKNHPSLVDIAEPKIGLQTGDNKKFIRQWYEVDFNKLGISQEDAKVSKYKWFPLNKGGDSNKWYYIAGEVVDWYNEGVNIKNDKIQKLKMGKIEKKNSKCWNENLYLKEGITWTRSSKDNFAVKLHEKGTIFETGAPTIVNSNTESLYYLLGLMNSKIIKGIAYLLNPTLGFQAGDINKIPIIIDSSIKPKIIKLSQECVSLSKKIWSDFETSWYFSSHPLIKQTCIEKKVQNAFENYYKLTNSQIALLKANEEEINKEFIKIYDLGKEMSPDISESELTVSNANLKQSIRSFISFAVGCMLGRYSLDQKGLVFAGGEFDHTKYHTFIADVDNIIPITDDEYFEDDMVNRFVEYVRVTFGAENFEENLDFVADSLTRKAHETARQRIRRYFLKEFYKDHVQMYQKRPIYWLFDSGKNDGFKALVYMHRYEPGLASRVRTDYLHLLQKKYEAEIGQMDLLLESDVSTSEKTKAKKRKEKLQKQLLECSQYDQVIAHVANQKIEIDLDDGVKVNYAKFQGVEIPQGEGKKPLKADVLAKI